MLKISVSALPKLFAAIAATQELYLPVEKADQVAFGKWEESATVRLDALKTVKSAKDFFFPQTENMVGFKTAGKRIEIINTRNEISPFVMMGVRACDAASFAILDRVFLSDPVDTYYKNRRENGTIITAACSRPEETCFCNAFGIDATEPAGDVITWTQDDTMYWKAVTEKGEKLTAAIGDLLEDAGADGEAAVAQQKAATKEILDKLPFAKLDLSNFGEDKLLEIFNSPKWAKLSEACLGCGTCTFVCPTCQCYDIREFDTGNGIQRFRCWDSCMYSDFTQCAHGNPRTSQLERFRQRFMHKLVYYPANNDGIFSCVGCGRCLAKCPISMNIVKVAKALGGTQA